MVKYEMGEGCACNLHMVNFLFIIRIIIYIVDSNLIVGEVFVISGIIKVKECAIS